MKTIKNMLVAMIAVFAVSCTQDDVENRPVVTPIDAPVLSAPEEGNSYVLSPDDMDLLAERFVWSAATFGDGVIPNYDVQVDFQGNSFASPQIIGTTNGSLQLAASTNVLNSALLALGATPFETANFEVRVRAYVGQNEIVSNVVEMIITPYTTEAPKLYIVGDFQTASGYGTDNDPASGAPIAAPAYGATNFEGYVYMAAASEFKILPTNTSADGAFGDDGAFAGGLEAGGASITVSTAGYYLIKVDTNAMTYSVTKTEWAIVGNGTPNGWDLDTDMTFDTATKKWYIVTALTTQPAPDHGMKFRANNGWDLNFGDTGADNVLDYGGTNISTVAGTYRIEMDLSVPRNYTYTVTPQ